MEIFERPVHSRSCRFALLVAYRTPIPTSRGGHQDLFENPADARLEPTVLSAAYSTTWLRLDDGVLEGVVSGEVGPETSYDFVVRGWKLDDPVSG